jgi:predicted Rossmann fold flavoprotein
MSHSSQTADAPSTADVLILGAGAAGLQCARIAGARDRRVVVLDHADQPCRKILISGGGKCNFTNRDVRKEHYLSANPHFCVSALAQYPAADFLAWIEQHRIAYEERADGQLFTRHGAKHIVQALLQDCDRAGVHLFLNTRIQQVEHSRADFAVHTSRGVFTAPRLVVATGGLAWPQCGATGLGYDLARQFGLAVITPRPGLVPLTLREPERSALGALTGIALRAQFTCARHVFCNDLLFTHTGLSGPAALHVSNYWQPGQPLMLNLLPAVDLTHALAARDAAHLPPQQWLARYLPRRVAQAVCALHQLPDKPLAQCSRADTTRVVAAVRRWQFTPAGTRDYDAAEVTTGGVDTAALSSKTMEVRAVPGLFFVGEVVDVTGQLGGYNLQWAWSSGFVAGQAA